MNILYIFLGILIIIFIKYLINNTTIYNKYKSSGYRIYDMICNLKLIDGQHEIDKNLWLGDFRSALDTTFLKSNNIKLVVNLSKN